MVTFFMIEDKKPRLPPQLVIPLGILAVSTAAILIRWAQSYAPSLTIAAFRLLLAVILLSPWVFFRHRAELRRLTGSDLRLALFSGLLLAVHFASWITSLEYTTVASSVVLVSTTPLWVAALAPVFLGERVSRQVLWGMIMALVGGLVVGLSDSCQLSAGRLICPAVEDLAFRGALLGDGLALLGALSGAGYLMVGRHLRGKLSLTAYVFVVYGMAAGVLTLVMLAQEGLPAGYPPQVYLWFVLLALVPQLLGHTILNWALRYLSTAVVSVTLLGEPVASTLLAAVFLGETPSWLKIFGAILILVGIVKASRQNRLSRE